MQDDIYFEAPTIGQQQYIIEVVPTTIEKSDGTVVETNQFSFTQHFSKVDLSSDQIELPGLKFSFFFSSEFVTKKINTKKKKVYFGNMQFLH